MNKTLISLRLDAQKQARIEALQCKVKEYEAEMDRLRDIIGENLYNYHYHQVVTSLLQYFSPCFFGLYYYFSGYHCSDHLIHWLKCVCLVSVIIAMR